MHKPAHERKGKAFPRSDKLSKERLLNLHAHKYRGGKQKRAVIKKPRNPTANDRLGKKEINI